MSSTISAGRIKTYDIEEQNQVASVWKYLRWTRMNRFHSELRTARAGSSTVTALANHWGFHELGRTADEYKQLFGQSPSATLASDPQPRYKRLADALRE